MRVVEDGIECTIKHDLPEPAQVLPDLKGTAQNLEELLDRIAKHNCYPPYGGDLCTPSNHNWLFESTIQRRKSGCDQTFEIGYGLQLFVHKDQLDPNGVEYDNCYNTFRAMIDDCWQKEAGGRAFKAKSFQGSKERLVMEFREANTPLVGKGVKVVVDSEGNYPSGSIIDGREFTGADQFGGWSDDELEE